MYCNRLGSPKNQSLANHNQFTPNMVYMHESLGNNIQEILVQAAIGPMEAKWGARMSPAQSFYCRQNQTTCCKLSQNRFLPNLATTCEPMFPR